VNTVVEAAPTEYRLVTLGRRQSRFSLLIPSPDGTSAGVPFVETDENLLDYLAAWESGNSWVLTGPPGVGKTATVQALSRLCGLPLHILQGHSDLEPGDIAGVPKLGEGGGWIGSPLLAATLTGGIAYIDDIGKIANERAFSLLASLLDHRRTLQSSTMGLTITAHPRFRFCCSMNSSDPALPGYIRSRLLAFSVDYPSHRQLQAIAKAHFGASEDAALLEVFKHWLAEQKQSLAPREALAILRFAKALRDGKRGSDFVALLRRAATHVLPRE